MLKSDISLNDIQAKLEFFNENNVKREAERLAKDPSFVAVQNACMKKTPDRGITAWKHVEEITDQLHSRIGRDIDQIGNVGEFLQLAGQHYNPVNNTKDARQHSLRNVCKKVSGLLVKQALYSDEGREILHLMALDGNANRINTLEEFTTNYLMDKKVFEPSKNHNIFDKLTSKFNHELAQDILKAYKKTGPRPEKINVIQNENNRNKNLNNQIGNKNNIVMGK